MMRKTFWIAAVLAAVSLTGCGADQSVQANYIGEDDARTAALTASGVVQDDASFVRTKLEEDDGRTYYDVEFTDANGVRYEYDIDAMTGTVISYESEGRTQQTGQPAVQGGERDDDTAAATAPSGGTDDGAAAVQSRGTDDDTATPAAPAAPAAAAAAGAVDADGAKQIALDDAGLTEDQVSFVRTELDRDDGRTYYEVEFYATADHAEYDYEIDASTGAIISQDYDAEHYSAPQSGGTVSEESVRQTVLAKVPGATEDNLRMRLERDDGRELYEGTIVYNDMKYDFEVDAYSGAIREWEAESVYD